MGQNASEGLDFLRMAVRAGDVDVPRERCNFAQKLLKPFSFLAFKDSLGTDVLNSMSCVPLYCLL